MPLHLVKLCVGAETVDDLKRWVKKRTAENEAAGRGRVHDHVTRMRPRQRDALLEGGSIYWVIKGVVLARQRILDMEPRTGADGIERTAIMLEPRLIMTEAQPRRAFQGWRYLKPQDAPSDLSARRGKTAPPPTLTAALAELGLL
ncbi:MAG: DUF1489 domain-containing protein [Pseudomonadota bacterium]